MYSVRQILYIILLSIAGTPAVAQVQFSDTTFQALIQQSKDENKGVMVNVYTNWCTLCHKMDSTVFADTSFGSFLNQRYLSLSLNAEEGFGIDFAMKYRIQRFPEILFFNSDGHLKFRLEGYLQAPALEHFIIDTDSLEQYLAPLPYPLDFVLDYPDFYRNSFKKRGERSFPSEVQITKFMASRDSITDEVTWGVLSKLVTDYTWADSVYKYRDILSKRYGQLEVNDKLQNFVYGQVKAAIKDNSESELYAGLRKADKYLGDRAPKFKMRYQLYFYQMQKKWITYAELGSEIARDSSLYDTAWLTEIAQTIHRNTKEPQAITPALNWMKTIVKTDSTYNTLGTEAWLYYKLENITPAENAADAALRAASAKKNIDTSEVEALLKMINLTR